MLHLDHMYSTLWQALCYSLYKKKPIYIIDILNKTKKPRHRHMLKNVLKGFGKAGIIDLFLNATSFCIFNFSFKSM